MSSMRSSKAEQPVPVDLWCSIEEMCSENSSREEGKSQETASPVSARKASFLHDLDRVQPRKKSILLVGCRGSGKSTIVQNFLNPNGNTAKIKPTVALEYTFGRRSNASGERKDVCEFWELGGGGRLLDLVPIVLKGSASVVVCVDLSAPEVAFDEAVRWAGHIRNLGPDIPLVILGTKFDRFENEDGLKRKALCQAMRFVAVKENASLLFMSKQDKTSLSYLRGILNHLAFSSEAKKLYNVDPNKPIMVTAGKDSIDKVGLPPGITADMTRHHIYDAWRDILRDYFPHAELETQESKEGEEIDVQLEPESIVDKCRAKKDKELERHRAQRARESAI